MKLKKLNVALSIWAVSGGLYFLGRGSDETATATSQQPAATAAAATGASGSLLTNAATNPLAERVSGNDFSPVGKQVVTIPWGHSFNAEKMPWEPTLKKWTVDSRVYYQMTGPINLDYLKNPASPTWATYLAYEVFFQRDGVNYDQWMLGPPQAVIYHYSTYAEPPPLGITNLSNSRYRMNVAGQQVTVTFWCYAHDTPTNIAFNYNVPGGGMAWFDTERHGAPSGTDQSHHNRDFWSNP